MAARLMDAFRKARMDVESSERNIQLYAGGVVQAVEFHKCFSLVILPKKDMEDVSVALGSIYVRDGGEWVLDGKFHFSNPLLTQSFSRGQIQAIEFAEYKEYRWASLQWGGQASMGQYQPSLRIGGELAKYENHDRLLVALDVYSAKCRWGKRVWTEVSRVNPDASFDAKILIKRPHVLPAISEVEKSSMMRVTFPMARAKKLFAWIIGVLVLLGVIAGWFNDCYDFAQKVVAAVSKYCGG